jgi:sortase (surface protein transpeptidase)
VARRPGAGRTRPRGNSRARGFVQGNSYKGPAVFIHLTELRGGDQILIDRADGTTATFVIQRVERHGKDAFPTQAVYGETPDPELRLITCGGQFDDKARRYLDNIIVYADRSG